MTRTLTVADCTTGNPTCQHCQSAIPLNTPVEMDGEFLLVRCPDCQSIMPFKRAMAVSIPSLPQADGCSTVAGVDDPEALAKQLIRSMEADNDCEFPFTLNQLTDLAHSIGVMERSGCVFSEETIQLIAVGEVSEVRQIFGVYEGFQQLNEVLEAIFNGEKDPLCDKLAEVITAELRPLKARILACLSQSQPLNEAELWQKCLIADQGASCAKTSLACYELENDGLIQSDPQKTTCYRLTEKGWAWLSDNTKGETNA